MSDEEIASEFDRDEEQKDNQMGSMYDLSPHPQWVGALHRFIQPYRETLLNGEFVESAVQSVLTVEELKGWMLQMYPFVHAFPKFLAEALIKVEDDYSRSFLIDNIRVEKAHAEHWIWMGQGFGLTEREMLELAHGQKPVLRDVQSLTDWMWYVNTKGSLAEAVAATSFAVEGATGDLARKALAGFESYGNRPGVDMSARTARWMRSHARFDDEHPKVALEVVKRYATTERLQIRVMQAAKRSLQLMDLAFDTAFRAYSTSDTSQRLETEQRVRERRWRDMMLEFPERRFGDRRGRRLRSVA